VTDRQILKVIAENAKKARLAAGLTQECLAEMVDLHWQTISNLEKGKFPFAVTSFVRLCHALDISPNRLIDGLPEPDRKKMEKIKKALARKKKPSLKALRPARERVKAQ
jgi:DNA-binding XRE family transcriptional regulator